MDFVVQKFVKLKLSPDEYTAAYEFTNLVRLGIFNGEGEMTETGAVMMGNCGSVLHELARHFRKHEQDKAITAMFRISEVYALQEAMNIASGAAKNVIREMTDDKLSEQEWLDIIAGVRIKAATELKNYPYYYKEGEYEYQ